jgi:sigma-E factor negative regulatory protein RseB
MHRVYRHNDAVLTLWPQSRVAVQEQREPLAGLSSPMPPLEARALEQYGLKLIGSERVAGRDAQVFLLVPRDEYRYPQRVWTDQATGLMLRVDVLGPGREVLESAAFSEVEIGIRPQPESVLGPMKKLDGYRVVQRQEAGTRMETEGWMLGSPVAGFRLANCVKRPLPGDTGDGSAASPVLQAVFSDGLTHVSLFVENFDPARQRTPMHTQIGATNTLMQRHGDAWWLTAMGDVPLATLRKFAAALERRP